VTEDKNNFALVSKPLSAVEKAAPGTKRVLAGMVNDTLALRKETPNRLVRVLFSAEHIIPKLKAKERFAVIREMTAHLIHIGQIRPQDEEVVVASLIKREKLMSTGYGFGCASPRGRVNCVKDIILAIGFSASGVEFDALDNQPVNLFAMLIAPAESQEHEAELQRFGTEIITTLCKKTSIRVQLFRSSSAADIWSILKPIYDEICSKK
jgi:mannitol/fructose-specific phosphotransferase system IIA component (Ntr-type)